MFSGKKIEKAGDYLSQNSCDVDSDLFSQSMDILSYFRSTHERPLNKIFNLLQEVTDKIDNNAIFAKRLKRAPSIISKLKRFKKMKLRTMQDIGGCRVIVSNKKKLFKIVRELKGNDFFTNTNGIAKVKNYIETPKDDGYRSFHMTATVKDDKGKHKKIEVQLRTFVQHYWATALEIIDTFTGQALKSNQGKEEWKLFFYNLSLLFAVFEDIHMFNQLNDRQILFKFEQIISKDKKLQLSCQNVQKLKRKLDVTNKLATYMSALTLAENHLIQSDKDGFVLVEINIKDKTLRRTIYDLSEIERAQKEYIKLEKESMRNKHCTIGFISTSAFGNIKEAYPNFFADSRMFLKLLEMVNICPIKKRFFNFFS